MSVAYKMMKFDQMLDYVRRLCGTAVNDDTTDNVLDGIDGRSIIQFVANNYNDIYSIGEFVQAMYDASTEAVADDYCNE